MSPTFKIARIYADPSIAPAVIFESKSKDAAVIRLANIRRCTTSTESYSYEIWESAPVPRIVRFHEWTEDGPQRTEVYRIREWSDGRIGFSVHDYSNRTVRWVDDMDDTARRILDKHCA